MIVDELEHRLPHAEELHAMDLADLKAAFAGESQAAEKYLVFAEKAEAEGLPNVANLFRAISFAETRHARNHLRMMAGVGFDRRQSADRLRGRIVRDRRDVPGLRRGRQSCRATSRRTSRCTWALKAEMDHKRMYAEARQTVLAGDDIADAAGQRVPGLRAHRDRRRARQVPRVCGQARAVPHVRVGTGDRRRGEGREPLAPPPIM